MPATSALPCAAQPELFTPGENKALSYAARREAVELCCTRCPAAEFAICAELQPEAGSVMAGVAYDYLCRAIPLDKGARVKRTSRTCKCGTTIPASAPSSRIWCTAKCYDAHKNIKRSAARRAMTRRRLREGEADARPDEVDALRHVRTAWTAASRSAQLVVVRHFHGEGWTDRRIAERYGITSRTVRSARQRLDLPANREPALCAGC